MTRFELGLLKLDLRIRHNPSFVPLLSHSSFDVDITYVKVIRTPQQLRSVGVLEITARCGSERERELERGYRHHRVIAELN